MLQLLQKWEQNIYCSESSQNLSARPNGGGGGAAGDKV
jgi:hypothetical protein